MLSIYARWPWDSPESKRKYRALIKKWRDDQNAKASGQRPDLTVRQLVELYLPYFKEHYRRNCRVTSKVGCIESATRISLDTCGEMNAGEFVPLLLKETRSTMIKAGWIRNSINKQVGRIRRIFRWASFEQFIDFNVDLPLGTLSGLQKGRTDTLEGEPVLPVPYEHIKAVRKLVTLPALYVSIDVNRSNFSSLFNFRLTLFWIAQFDHSQSAGPLARYIACIGEIRTSFAVTPRDG